MNKDDSDFHTAWCCKVQMVEKSLAAVISDHLTKIISRLNAEITNLTKSTLQALQQRLDLENAYRHLRETLQLGNEERLKKNNKIKKRILGPTGRRPGLKTTMNNPFVINNLIVLPLAHVIIRIFCSNN